MRKISTSILLIGIALLLSVPELNAQQTIEARKNDVIDLQADEYRGSIQWQASDDGEVWIDLEQGNKNPFETSIPSLPYYYRAKIVEDSCVPHYSEVITVTNDGTLRWSQESTWGSEGKPVAGQEIIIPEGVHILLDEDTPGLAGLTIAGTLEFDRKDLELTSEWIVVNGLLEVGTESHPFEQKAIITLTDTETEAEVMEMGTRGIMVMSGTLELHGAIPQVIWTKLGAHAEAGSTSIELMETVNWEVGDEIVIAPTDYYEAGLSHQSITQLVEVIGVSDKTVSLSTGLNAHRWGLLQYATENGMSLSSNNIVEPPVPDTETTTTPLVVDERAEVGNMTRNIVIQAPNDDVWNSQGFGVHTMIMPNATAHVEGVEFKRAGQRGRLRRYPFHWHMLSYSGSQTLDDAAGQYFKNNTINSSTNRGVVIHGTNGILVQNNIIFDIDGHGIFTEDAVERRNTIDGNLVLHVRNPPWGSELLQHEQGELGSSGFWISNPDNTVTNNIAADCQTFGYWLAFPEHPWGLSKEVLHTDGLVLRPNRLQFGIFDNNTSHSQKNDGIHLDNPQINDAGDTSPIQYWSTTDGRSGETLTRFSLSRYKTWKNRDNGAWDRAPWTDIFEVVSADNCGRFFAGSGSDGVIERSLIVGTSLNFMQNETGRPEIADFQFNPSSAPTAFATYHSAFSMRQNIVVNFPVTEHDRMGVFASDDYYIRAVDKGHIRNYDNLFIASHPGVKLQPSASYFTFSSALWDPYGFWGPEENYLVYDVPFLTYGKQVHIAELGTDIVGGVSVEGPFYGFRGFVLHGVGWGEGESQPFNDYMAIQVRRLDPNNLSHEIARWTVDQAEQGWALNHMRDFATTPEGIYELTFPNETSPPTDFQMYVENMLEPEDVQVIAIEFDGSITNPTVLLRREDNWNNYRVYQQANSQQEVIDSNGETWWQDHTNNLMWVKLQGGAWIAQDDDEFDETINEIMTLKILVL